jgi:hypothetical protein
MWDGMGTQADLSCDKCGQEEGIQVSDLFDYDDPRRHSFDMAKLSYPADVVILAKIELINEWNKRTQ